MNFTFKKLIASFLILLFLGAGASAQRVSFVAFRQLPRDMQLYARDDNNMAEVPVSGRVEEAGYDHMSVVTFRNNTRTGYNKSVLNYAGNSFASFDIKPKIKAEMADYSVEIYACRTNDSLLIARKNEIVAGDFFVINGQSNASAIHFGDWGSKYCRTVGRIPDDNPGMTPGDTLWIQSSWSWPYVGAWGLQLQRKILENNGIPTCVINGSSPGSKIAWHTERNAANPTSPSLYGNLLARIKVANPSKIRDFFWYQGEQEVLEDIRDYPEQYDKLFKFWQMDYPMVDKFIVLQITVLFNPFYVAGTIRDFQRRTKYLYPRSDHFSTMGLPYFDGIHYDIKGYNELGKRLYNFIGPDLYKSAPIDNAATPDIKKAFYTTDKKDAITLIFDEGQKLVWPKDTLIEDVNYNFFAKSLREVFYFDGDESESKAPVVKEGTATENRVNLTLFGSSSAKKLNYLPAYKGEKIRIYYGPYLTNVKGLGAFSFQNVDINDALIISNLKAEENTLKTVDVSWTTIPGAAYILYRKAEGEQSFTKVQDLTTTQISYNDVNVSPEKLYTYRIQAISSGSESEVKEVSIKTSPVLALPVTLVTFGASRLDESIVKVNWKTTAEVNNSQFEIQRSVYPESGFLGIGTVDGAGNSGSVTNYEFKDNNDISQWTYYRLKQVDFDGSYTYSRIVSVQPFRLKLAVVTFPNPSSNENIQFKVSGLNSPAAISVTVYDSKGFVIYKNEKYQLDNRFLISIDSVTKKHSGQLFIKIVKKDQSAVSSFVVY